MALVEVSACCSHKEQHHAHTQDKEHAVTTGLSALKGKIPHMWKAKSHGRGTAPHGAICQQHKSFQRHQAAHTCLANGHSEHRERQDLRRLDQSLLCHKPQQEKQLGPGQEPL